MHLTLIMPLIIIFLALLTSAYKAFKLKCFAYIYYTSFKLLLSLKKSRDYRNLLFILYSIVGNIKILAILVKTLNRTFK